MARGLPAIWSGIAAVPFVLSGGYFYLARPFSSVPRSFGLPILLFGLFILAGGLYIHIIAAPEPPTMREGEKLVDSRNPAQRVAAVKTFVGLGFLIGSAWLLFGTKRPYVYPTTTFFVGLYLFSTGIHTYWTNTLTTYYVTTQRLIKEYRFVSLVREELPFDKVRGVEERRSIWETLVDLGNVRVASGGGGTLEIVIENIYSPRSFADEIRNLI